MNKRLHFIATIMMLMLSFSTASADDRKVTSVTMPNDEGTQEVVQSYLYDAKSQLMWRQNPNSSSLDVYTYNEKGQLVGKLTRSWIPYDRAFKDLNEEIYTYAANGQMQRMDQTRNIGQTYESKRYYLYTAYDAQGNATAWQHYNNADVLYYEYKAEYTYNTAGLVTKKVVQEFDPDYPEDGYYAFETYEYTYQGNGDINSESITVYKSDGSEKSKTTQYYHYSDLNAKYVPQNLKATHQGSDQVMLTWDAVDGAEGYVVNYGIEHIKVSGTTFKATNIEEGNTEFTVQAVVSGEEKNAATPVEVSVADKGKLAAQNLIAGEAYKKVEQTDSEDRTYYVVPLSWEIPAGHSEIKDIRIYYNSRVYGNIYVSTDKAIVTNLELKLDEYEVRNTAHQPILDADGSQEIDEETGEPKFEDVYTDGANVNISVVLLYGSGESEHSNIVTVNPYNQVNGITDGIESVQKTHTTTPATTLYDLSGRRLSRMQKGITIKNGKKVIK